MYISQIFVCVLRIYFYFIEIILIIFYLLVSGKNILKINFKVFDGKFYVIIIVRVFFLFYFKNYSKIGQEFSELFLFLFVGM